MKKARPKPDKDVSPTIAMMARIESVLKERGLTRSDLPRLTSFPSLRFTRWFKGIGVPDVYQAITLASDLDVPLLWLTGHIPDRKTKADTPTFDEQALIDAIRHLGVHETLKWLLDHPEIRNRQRGTDPREIVGPWTAVESRVYDLERDKITEVKPLDLYESIHHSDQSQQPEERPSARADSAGRTEDGQEGEAS